MEKALIGISAGINSAAVLCWLKQSGIVPVELHLFYAHLEEHSPDSYPFVKDLIRYARKHFPNVKVKITRNSILRFFEKEKMIPHPIVSPCTRVLKIKDITDYAILNNVTHDLIGYVKHEFKRRSSRQSDSNLSVVQKFYPIAHLTDDDCFDLVKAEIGWYPKIYDIRDDNGKRVFKHNNCLPCKNMHPKDFQAVKQYYPDYYERALVLSEKLNKHWGRSADAFYTTFGRDLGQNQCVTCTY